MEPVDEYLLCEKCGSRLPIVNTPVGPHEGCGGNLMVIAVVTRAAERAEEAR